MQNTRINILLDTLILRLKIWLQNPWRRTSLSIVSLLFGVFLGGAISTIAGQTAELDIVGAALLTVLIELVNWIVYRQRSQINRSILIDILNCLKLGLIYGLFLEAFKLGS
ncbi:hypothetical protein BCD67_19600 [Oscillatoriales cyanobacterium USR001]|nr:hypothetical protein BCD67_19600 [Oscillatoriales cyanobacterium USR001]